MENLFKTKNLFIATFILASGEARFHGLETLDNKTKLFVFSPAQIAVALETAYFSGDSLPAKTLFSEYNTLKDLLFQRTPNGL